MFYNPLAPDLTCDLSPEAQTYIQHHTECACSSFATQNTAAIRRCASDISEDTFRRPSFLRDSEKIIHTPAYNRLAGKTQVFSFRDNDDLTRRGLHVQLVSRIARDIGRCLGLNLDLIEAIALGHDIGHTPFGHAGERFLNEIYHRNTGRYFMHNVHSVRVLDVLYGRNVTLQTLDGIICHNGEFEQQKFRMSNLASFDEFDLMVESCLSKGYTQVKKLVPSTMEGCVVRISDIIAYVGKDRQDAIVAGLVNATDFEDGLGSAYNAWALSAFSTDVIENSLGKDSIEMSAAAFAELKRAKKENSEKIYMRHEVNGECVEAVKEFFFRVYDHQKNMLKQGNEQSAIFKHHIEPITDQLAHYNKTYAWQDDLDMCVVDFIASMTDDYFIAMCMELFDEAKYLIPKRAYFDHVQPHLI